ncbi:GLPGLI family protein [Psychroflexus sp. CAK8W]|uniref:GLPGLI family protein n=1 Tax=Psychroflexus longus TaxID=2873596 RepID=A0ABS7XKM9_9FLAO|nr:GLPGLI family protein [Psychroflexus longus]MBZ9779525.1 GLPGLI family protein [Psychroflexus longus]
MKNIICLLITFITVHFTNGQDKSSKIYVEYAVNKGSINSTEYLIANTNNALYTTDFIEVKNDKTIESEDGDDYRINPEIVKVNAMKYYSQLDSPYLYFVSQSKNSENTIVAVDSLPKLQWELSPNKTKEINTFTCFEAKTTFRGSKIVAYYAPGIPAGFGPFKLKGLPGLILEAYNEYSGLKYHWKAIKIISPFNQKLNLKFSEELYDSPLVTYRSIVEKFDNKLKQMDERMKARVSRGGSITLNKTERVSLEKIYEWEEK